MSDTYYTENYTSSYESNMYVSNAENTLSSNNLFSEKKERINYIDKDFDTLLSVNNS